ncbi:MAG TPA: 30S ribosomal protein THX [Gelidibacter sp.]|nr:30S ribosomal protein THX [Gelidibacter sp.]HXJ98254.1 30S ribosomal protein THX [Gelidibacter sp.]
MGKGDKKTRRGKIQRGSYGVKRLRIKKKTNTLEKISVDKKSKP